MDTYICFLALAQFYNSTKIALNVTKVTNLEGHYIGCCGRHYIN